MDRSVCNEDAVFVGIIWVLHWVARLGTYCAFYATQSLDRFCYTEANQGSAEPCPWGRTGAACDLGMGETL